MPKLPVWKIVSQAYAFVWNKKIDFLKLSILPIMMLAISSFILDHARTSIFIFVSQSFSMKLIDAAELISTPLYVVRGLVSILIVTAFSIVWHRLFLVHSEIQITKNLFLWRKRHMKFLFTAIVLGVGGNVVAIPFSVTFIEKTLPYFIGNVDSSQILILAVLHTFILSTLVMILIAFLTSRWSIMFPSIAVNRFMSFKQGWRLTSGNGLRLWAMTVLATFPLYSVSFVFGSISLWLAPEAVLPLMKSSFYLIIIAVGVSALSASYRFICVESSRIVEEFD